VRFRGRSAYGTGSEACGVPKRIGCRLCRDATGRKDESWKFQRKAQVARGSPPIGERSAGNCGELPQFLGLSSDAR